MNRETRKEAILILEQLYGHLGCGLNFTTPYELLVATMLSAQCTDVRVNQVTAELFKQHGTPEQMCELTEPQLIGFIRTCGLAPSKAKNILKTSRILLEQYGGDVPKILEELTALPGVGRKTANVVMSNAFGLPAIAVDTHVFRVSRRMGMARGENVLEVEKSLMKNIPKSQWSQAHHWIIWHGRNLCTARKPQCEQCPLTSICEWAKKNKIKS